MKKTLNEFKKFAMRGNVVDMAVGIIIGGAFYASRRRSGRRGKLLRLEMGDKACGNGRR